MRIYLFVCLLLSTCRVCLSRRRCRPCRDRSPSTLPPAGAGHHEARDDLHGREGQHRGRLRLVVPARLLAALGRTRGARHDDLDPAAGHARRWGTCSSTRTTRRGDEYYYQAAEKAARALMRAQHPSGGWNYVVDFAGEQSLQRVVRHGRPQRLAPRGVPALLGQRDVRRRRDGGVGEVPAAHVRGEARPEVQAGARQRHPVRPRQPVPGRRLAAALSR